MNRKHKHVALCVALAVSFTGMVHAAEQKPLKIGVLSDMSGPYADLAGKGSLVAVEMAIEDFGGKMFEKPIELVSADHQNKPETGANIARRWYDHEGVDMITDLTNSAVAITVQGIAKERKKISMVTNTASTALTEEACSPYGVHWTYNAYSLSHGTAQAVLEDGGKTWYFITADFAFGHNLQANATKVIEEQGGKVLGASLAPPNTMDFSSHLMQAQGTGAQVIAVANSGTDASNTIKQAVEFGITRKARLALLLGFITDIKSLGLKNAQGLVLTTAFYWDRNDETREWSKRFYERHKSMPTMVQAGAYSAVMHYLKAVKEQGSLDSDAVMKRMHDTPVNDFAFKNGHIRPDGMMVHDMYLVEVKSPEESKGDWDFYKVLSTIPADKAFQPLSESTCPLVKK
ncbi:MAG: ABC transporter substrate-binding protein [Pusillimonas sp.]